MLVHRSLREMVGSESVSVVSAHLEVTLLVWPVVVSDVVVEGNDLVVGWYIRPRREWHCMIALQVKSSDLMGRRSSLPTSVGLGEWVQFPCRSRPHRQLHPAILVKHLGCVG